MVQRASDNVAKERWKWLKQRLIERNQGAEPPRSKLAFRSFGLLDMLETEHEFLVSLSHCSSPLVLR